MDVSSLREGAPTAWFIISSPKQVVGHTQRLNEYLLLSISHCFVKAHISHAGLFLRSGCEATIRVTIFEIP